MESDKKAPVILVHCAFDKMLRVSDLTENERNRKNHSQGQIDRFCKVLLFQGWRRPIRISKLSGSITAGHLARLGAIKLGLDVVPVDFQDYKNLDEEYADLIADNALNEWERVDRSAINTDLPDIGPMDIDVLGLKDFRVEVFVVLEINGYDIKP